MSITAVICYILARCKLLCELHDDGSYMQKHVGTMKDSSIVYIISAFSWFYKWKFY